MSICPALQRKVSQEHTESVNRIKYIVKTKIMMQSKDRKTARIMA